MAVEGKVGGLLGVCWPPLKLLGGGGGGRGLLPSPPLFLRLWSVAKTKTESVNTVLSVNIYKLYFCLLTEFDIFPHPFNHGSAHKKIKFSHNLIAV